MTNDLILIAFSIPVVVIILLAAICVKKGLKKVLKGESRNEERRGFKKRRMSKLQKQKYGNFRRRR